MNHKKGTTMEPYGFWRSRKPRLTILTFAKAAAGTPKTDLAPMLFGFRVWGLGFRVWGLGFRV